MFPAVLASPCRQVGGYSRLFVLFFAALAACIFAGCGGASSGTTGGGGGDSPSYSISVSPAKVELVDSTPQTLTVSVTSNHGYKGTVFVQIAGLPMGVGDTPSGLNSPLTSTGGSAAVHVPTDNSAETGSS